MNYLNKKEKAESFLKELFETCPAEAWKVINIVAPSRSLDESKKRCEMERTCVTRAREKTWRSMTESAYDIDEILFSVDQKWTLKF